MPLNPFDRIRRSYHGEAARLLKRLHELKSLPSLPGVGYSEEIQKIETQLEALKGRKDSAGSAWKTVKLARHQDRPADPRLHRARLPRFRGAARRPAAGRRPRDRGRHGHLRRPHHHDHRSPEGPRSQGASASQLRHGAARGLPQGPASGPAGREVPHAGGDPGGHSRAPFPGADAEEGGQAGAIARTLQVFAGLSVPTVAVVIGEGGSGGALGSRPLRPGLHARERHLLGHHARSRAPPSSGAMPPRPMQAAEALRLTALGSLPPGGDRRGHPGAAQGGPQAPPGDGEGGGRARWRPGCARSRRSLAESGARRGGSSTWRWGRLRRRRGTSTRRSPYGDAWRSARPSRRRSQCRAPARSSAAVR